MIALDRQLQPVRALAIDTETKHLRWWDKSQGRPVFLLQWSDEESDDCCTPDDEEGMARFHAAVSGVNRLLFANAGFDIGMMRTSGIMDALNSGHDIVDVQTLARIVLPERGFKGYKLKSLGADLLGADAKDEQKHLKELCSEIGLRTLNAEGAFKALWDAYPREVEAYGMKDTRLTFDLYELLCKRASPQDLAIAQFEVDVEDVLRRAEEWGVLVDKTALAALRAQYEATVEDMHSSLLQYLSPAALGDDGNAASQDELRQGLLDAGIPLYRMTDKSKKLATNKDALSEFEDDYPVINLLFGWRAAKKLLATYIGALELADPRCHTSFNSVGARTSRMTARSPNMQNLPRAKKDSAGVRSAIVPEKGNALLVCDYDSVEVAGLAHYLKRAVHEPGLADALEAGLDPHARTAARVFGMKTPAKGGPPSPLHGAELYDYYCKGAPGEPFRVLAKETTFSSMYGIGYKKLARRLGVTEQEAKAIKNEVLNSIDGYWDLVDALRLKMAKTGYLRTVLGRRLDVPPGKTHIFLNSIVQGSCAEVMKLGMLAAVPRLAEWDYRIILVVHDELVSEGPARYAAEAKVACIEAMESVSHNLLTVGLKATGDWTTKSYGDAK